MTTLARVVETCQACPSQWDAWTTEGQYLYLRYRFGHGSVERHANPDVNTWGDDYDPVIAEFHDPDQPYAGTIELDEFLRRAELQLAPDAEIVPWAEFLRSPDRW
ncbi:hypothetical protein EDD90_3289 [Streptomyces sp. Ag109_O5-1]|uniref:hypothetical protein n=1 Tax=Streptomyces sp. Ag109_O5-1 TaxID=1938851 RepID=UPI000F5040FB|nr:hypothetical protein [Streptomyces sp. Ag109_O5-1]RPE40253.1 hypothetical protein EDD90_3289 [Streptomyces sp. Ag109_O5-1]